VHDHKSNRRLNLKKVGLWSYGVVVVSILVAMVLILMQPEHPAPVEFSDAENEAIQAVLEGGSSTQSVPIERLEALVPERMVEPAWRTNAAAWKEGTRAKIAIVIDDLGLDEQMTRQMATFNAPLTMAFLPYAENLAFQTEFAAEQGHELMVHLPMQPKNDAADPGPNALLESVDPDEFERRILWNLGRFEGYVGVNNHMGSALTENPGLMVRLMVHLRKGGFLFLDSLTSPESVGARAAAATGVPHISRDIFLDNNRDIQSIIAQLEATKRIARARGYAVAIGHPYEETLKALEFWYGGLDTSKFMLVPLSQLVAQFEAKTAELN